MKKQIITIASIAFIAITSLVFYSCKKNKEVEEKMTNKFPKSIPVTFPIFPTFDKINDHLRHLAFGSASLLDLIYLSGNNTSQYISEIEARIVKEEAPFETINNNITSTIFKKWNTGGSVNYTNSMIDAIDWSNTDYRQYQPRTNTWSGYDWSAMSGFNYNQGDYYTLLRIPDFDKLKNDPSRLTKPIVVVSNEVDANGDLILPIVGFTYDPIADKVNMVQWNDEDDFEDETGYYIWVIDYDAVALTNSNSPSNCLGENAPIANDDFCDVDCEENSTTSPNDCNPSFIKKVWIEDLEIIEDYKQKCGTNYQWLESRLHGQYEIAYQCVVAHSRGKLKAMGGLLEESWDRENIRMTNKLGVRSCNFRSKGSPDYKMAVTPWMWWKDNQNTQRNTETRKAFQPRAFLSENYKPWRDTIYLLVYEYDKPLPGRNRNINITTRPGKTYQMQYTTRNNEGPFRDKTNSNNFVSYNSLPPINGSIVPNAQVIMITPQSWPGQGLFSVVQDEFTVNGVGSSNGANPNTYSIRIKLKYGN